MIPVKIQCGCGQRYAFDIVPFHGRMPSPVACPSCGADGTAAANGIIAQALAAQPAAAPMVGIALDAPAPTPVAATAAPAPVAAAPKPGIRLAAAPAPSAAVEAPPPAPRVGPPPVPMHSTAQRGVVAAKPKPVRGNDGWSKPETGVNKLGQYIVIGPGIISALLSAHFLGIEVPSMILWIVVGVTGALGGALNILGRGPILAGILVGITIGFGGYAASYWWINGRHRVYTLEATIAFVIGAIPGFLLQALLQQILKKRANAGG
jgi:uncharacterized membrane protein YphA (DoxX/SURF4 family)